MPDNEKEELLKKAKELGLDKTIKILDKLGPDILKARIDKEISKRNEEFARELEKQELARATSKTGSKAPSKGKTKKSSSNSNKSWEMVDFPIN